MIQFLTIKVISKLYRVYFTLLQQTVLKDHRVSQTMISQCEKFDKEGEKKTVLKKIHRVSQWNSVTIITNN